MFVMNCQYLFLIITQDILCGPGIRETIVTPYPLLRSSWLSAVPIKPLPPPENHTVT